MAFQNMLVDDLGAVRRITLNRPDKLNALNHATLSELHEAFEAAGRDPSVHVVVLTGAGPKAFVAGADISELAQCDVANAERLSRTGSRIFRAWETLSKPVIAAVNGFALGGGCELAMACHVRLASENAKFGQPEVKLGTSPGYGGTVRLPRLIGRGRATELLLTGGMIDANTALQYGLVNAVYPVEALLDVAKSMAKEMMANGPLALAHAIEVVAKGANLSMDEALALESRHFGELGRTADMREGTKAFLEKRPAAFKGA